MLGSNYLTVLLLRACCASVCYPRQPFVGGRQHSPTPRLAIRPQAYSRGMARGMAPGGRPGGCTAARAATRRACNALSTANAVVSTMTRRQWPKARSEACGGTCRKGPQCTRAGIPGLGSHAGCRGMAASKDKPGQRATHGQKASLVQIHAGLEGAYVGSA